MAGTTKRLRRKTTVSQPSVSEASNELMLLTSEWWMQFLLPVGRYMTKLQWRSRYTGAWIWVWRLLSRDWCEVWDQGFRIKLIVHEARVSDLCHAARSNDDLKFSRDSCNKVKYFVNGKVDEGRYCTVLMAWNTFNGLRPIRGTHSK